MAELLVDSTYYSVKVTIDDIIHALPDKVWDKVQQHFENKARDEIDSKITDITWNDSEGFVDFGFSTS